MKKLESSLLNMVVVLTLVSVITGGLLAAVNSVTEGPIQEQKDKALADGIKAVMGADDIKVTADDKVNSSVDGKDREYIIHRVANANGEPIGVAVESASQGFSGDVKVLVGFDKEGTIKGYTILEHAETPGLGARAVDWFQAGQKGDIIGQQPSKGKLTVSKDGGQIDAITAATITSRAFSKAVDKAYQAFMANKAQFMNNAPTKEAAPVMEAAPAEENNETEGGQSNE